jgi:hypothetical protein
LLRQQQFGEVRSVNRQDEREAGELFQQPSALALSQAGLLGPKGRFAHKVNLPLVPFRE